jgi:hypothetical protein
MYAQSLEQHRPFERVSGFSLPERRPHMVTIILVVIAETEDYVHAVITKLLLCSAMSWVEFSSQNSPCQLLAAAATRQNQA